MFNLKLYNYDEEFVSIDDMMIEKNFIKEIMFPQPNQEQLEEILNSLADYEGYLYQLYLGEELFSSGVVSIDSLAEDIAPMSTYENSNNEMNNEETKVEEVNAMPMPRVDEEGIIKGKIL
jgi:hypothetical protein